MKNIDTLNNEITICRDCTLAEGRINAVPGKGQLDAPVLFIGIAPQGTAERQGEPLSPRTHTGKILAQWLTEIDLSYKEIYLTNLLKCNPDRKVRKLRLQSFDEEVFSTEIRACRKWLTQEIEILQPKVIVTLGAPPLHQFFPDTTVGSFEATGRLYEGKTLFALFHPRNVGNADCPKNVERLKELRNYIQRLRVNEGTDIKG
jgi:uracil-DNA glycosylase family 4